MNHYLTGSIISALQLSAVAETLTSEVSFTKHHLHESYISEGATLGDIDGDGQNDVIAGTLWWKGPAFKESFSFAPYESYPLKGAKPMLANYAKIFFSFPDELTGDKWLDLIQVGLPNKPAHLVINPAERTWPPNQKDSGAKFHAVQKNVCHESPQYLQILGTTQEVTQKQLLFYTGGRITLAQPTADASKPWEALYVSDASKPKKPYVHGLGAGDINGDHLPDIIEKDGWWEQPKNWDKKSLWKFHPYKFAPGKGGSQMFVHDFDGDGDNDVISALDAHGYGISWFEQISKDGAVTFQPHPIITDNPADNPYGVSFSQPHAMECADINGDGIKDFITGKTYYAHLGKDPGAEDPAVLYWFQSERQGDGSVKFLPHLIDDNSGVGRQISVGDLNGDKKLDLVTSNKKGVFAFIQD